MAPMSAGSSLLGTNCHGPSVLQERNQRPEVSTYSSSSVGSLNTFAVVFSTYSSDVPSTAANRGGPLVTINSAGSEEMKIVGGASTSSFGISLGLLGLAPSNRSTVFAATAC